MRLALTFAPDLPVSEPVNLVNPADIRAVRTSLHRSERANSAISQLRSDQTTGKANQGCTQLLDWRRFGKGTTSSLI
jgi:hypothetical protein